MNKTKGYKGFDKNLQCRGFQYKVGKDYEQDGDIKCCENGFHLCENPFNVFSYYPPSDNNRFCRVEGSGAMDESGDKKAFSKIHITTEIGLNGIINAGVKFILDKVKRFDKNTNTGDRSAATNTGNYSAAKVEGKESIAIVTGKKSKASGSLGCWIVLTERDGDYHILDVKAFKVDGKKIKADTFYILRDGKAVEVTDDKE